MIENIENWKEITKGIYRYVISSNCCYEIHVLYHSAQTDIQTANAALFVVGDWRSKENGDYFERECLLKSGPLISCLGLAVEDYESESK